MIRIIECACVALFLGVVVSFPADGAGKPVFPLSVSADGRHLVDASGAPFLIHGDTAWSLIAQLRREDVEHYLTDRRKRGFNAILVSLLERKFSDNAPANAYGVSPFAAEQNFGRPEEAYFAHADWVLQRAADEGFLVLLTPSYLGFNGGDEGWYRDMSAAGSEALRRYGEWLGRRYRDFTNILWVNGGDFDPPDKSLVRAIAEGIRSEDPQALHTAHGAPESSSLDYWRGERWLDVNAVYTYGPVHEEVLDQRTFGVRIPSFLIESVYEGEHGSTPRQLRAQAYQALLTGAAGHIFGNNPIWYFDGPGLYSSDVTWKEALGSDGAASMTHLISLMRSLPWWTLVPDEGRDLLVDGQGPREERAVAAAAGDGSFALVYLPTRRQVILDLGGLAGPRVVARWYDPSSGAFTTTHAPVPAQGLHRFGGDLRPNASGEDDWILVLESQS